MNIIQEIENVLKKPHLIGKKVTASNNAANAIIQRLNELGYEIYKKEAVEKKDKIRDKAIELIEREEEHYNNKAYEELEKGNIKGHQVLFVQSTAFTRARWIVSEMAEEAIKDE